jgi:hypothetical protein
MATIAAARSRAAVLSVRSWANVRSIFSSSTGNRCRYDREE